ncbi:Transposable element tcb2 transposase, partial [Caligus rogercresseyi]
STRDLNALTDLDTYAASKDMATDVEQKGNRQMAVPMVFRTKNPAAVMVLGVISSEGHVMPPHFFEPKQRVNRRCTWRSSTLWPLEEVHFQKDTAPAHKANTVQAWLKENVPHFWDPQTWPSNSPDLNPCDYYL